MEFVDTMTEPTLQEKLHANKARSISQADATANKEKQQRILQQQKLEKQKEENSAAYQKYQKDLAEYEKQKKEYDAAVKQLEAEQKAEQVKIEQAKQAEQKRIADQKAINDKYDAQITALGAKPSKYYYKPKYYTNRYTGQTRLIGHTRESNHNAIKNYNSKVNSINRDRSTALTNFEISYSDIPATFIASARREAGRSSGVNILARAQQKWDSFLAQSEHRRQSSITTAKSNAVKAREQHEKTIREYEAKRESAPTPIPSVIDKPLTPATKTRPKVHSSSYFKDMEKTPVSIFGTTPLQSNKAEQTYDTTQAQQKELFSAVTKATDYKQAISLREKAMDKNPYVGTANTVFEKGKAVGSSGVLIEKKLREQDDVFEELAKPISPKQEIQTDVVIPQNLSPEMETQIISSKNSQIPTYEFPKQIIQLSNTPKHYDSWRYMSSLLDLEPKTPSKTDKLLNKYLQNNQKQIDNTKETGDTTPIKIPVLDAVRDYGVEFGLNLATMYAGARGKLYNEPEIITQSKIEKIYDSTPHEKSLEAVLFDSAIQSSKNNSGTINPSIATPNVIPKKQSQSVPTSSSYIKEKTQTWQGAEYLAGTIGISVLGAFVPFGRGKSAIGQVAKPVIKTAPQSPNNLAYLLKQSHQEPKIITKKVTVEDGGTFDVIDFDAMKKAKTTPYKPTTHDKIKKKSKKLKKDVSSKIDQTILKQKRKLQFENAMYQHELEKSMPKTKPKSNKTKKPSRNNPISKASRKIKFENAMYNHELEKTVTKSPETPMLDKLLGKSSRYVKTSAKINNKKVKDKSTQIKDTFSDTIKDNILDPVSKRTTGPIKKATRKLKVSKQINEFNLEKLLQDSAPKKYDVTNSMKKPEINQNVFNDIVKNNKKQKAKLTEQQKAEPGIDYNNSNNYKHPELPDYSKQSITTKQSSFTEQVLEKPKVKPSSRIKSKSKRKQSDFDVVEQVLHPNRPKIKSAPVQTSMLDNLLNQMTGQHHTIKHDVTPKTDQNINAMLDNLLKQNPKFDEISGVKSKKKQRAILYDLLVQQGKQGAKGRQDYGFVFVNPPKLTTKPIQQTPQKTRIKTPKKLPVSIKIPEIGIGKSNRTKKRKPKHAAKYSIWNVDVDNIGTLPGDELVTSQSTKIFKDLDKRQKTHSKSTGKSKTRKTVKKSTSKKKSKKW